MTLQELEALFRSTIRDVATPQLFSQAQVRAWLNEAMDEACLRADLILEDADPSLCEIVVVAPQASLALHEAITRVTYATWQPAGSTERFELVPIDRIELTRMRPDWRTTTERPHFLIQEDKRLRLGCIPDTDGTIYLECYRTQLELMDSDSCEPEISRTHHPKLVDWALHKAYEIPDAETVDLAASAKHLAAFERIFGRRPDADLRKSTEAVPQFNKAYF